MSITEENPHTTVITYSKSSCQTGSTVHEQWWAPLPDTLPPVAQVLVKGTLTRDFIKQLPQGPLIHGLKPF
jgi:hypothetical protein